MCSGKNLSKKPRQKDPRHACGTGGGARNQRETTHIPAGQLLLMGWKRTTRRAQREIERERGQDGTGEARINGQY
jgi:hypothetical protein